MTAWPGRARIGYLAVLAVVAAATVYAAGRQAEPPWPPARPVEVQRLGPEPGEPVAGYLARARASLPPPAAGDAWALVQLARLSDTATAAEVVVGARLSRVVFRVPMPRVQTALVTREVPGQRPAAELADAQRQAADDRADAAARLAADGARDADAADGSDAADTADAAARAVAIATAEAHTLRGGCACVLAMLVRADRAGLDAIAARPLVRSVHAAAPGTRLPEIATAPLLPEQDELAGPVPDDGPVPTE